MIPSLEEGDEVKFIVQKRQAVWNKDKERWEGVWDEKGLEDDKKAKPLEYIQITFGNPSGSIAPADVTKQTLNFILKKPE